MIILLSFSKVIVIRYNHLFLRVQGCRYTTLVDSRYRYNRYRYHKNSMINKDISPLVGIVFSLAVRASSSLPEQCDLFVVPWLTPTGTMI
jgi:hypothetical protein